MLFRVDLCLVGTSNPENLGGVARLAENFGLSSLALVAPRAALDDPRALVVGRVARERLAAARVTADLDAAVEGCSYVVGFSARRGSERPMVGLRGLVAHLAERAPAGRVALVFGPEESGLVNADVDRCDVVACIDTPGSLPSLNLTQAVAIALWELAGAAAPSPSAPASQAASQAASQSASQSASHSSRGGATRAEIDAFVDHAVEALVAVDYFRGEDRERQRVHLRRLVAAAALRSSELRSLHGICAHLLGAKR
ncbi:MAG: methyltransferase [Myxococcales bacterium]|nr:methyltransferase [Myxococcales bacterium]